VAAKRTIIAKMYAEVLKAARTYFDREGFIEVPTPFFSRGLGSCENTKTLFSIDYFGTNMYLRQTAQLYLELLMPSIEKVWCVGPSFRAELADDRHLPEFTLLEMEFCGDFQELLTRIEDLVYKMASQVAVNINKELAELSVDIARLESLRRPFKRITYEDAIKILDLEWGTDLVSRYEKHIVELLGNQPLFITHFPEKMKFFNMRTNARNSLVVNSADLILPFSGEAAGSAEREFEYEKVYEKLKHSIMFRQLEEAGGSITNFGFYLNHLRDHGSVLHSGCGIGVERVIQFLLGTTDIRDSTLFLSEEIT